MRLESGSEGSDLLRHIGSVGAGTEAFPLTAGAASGTPLSRLLADHRDTVDRIIRRPCDGEPPWHFITTAPVSAELV